MIEINDMNEFRVMSEDAKRYNKLVTYLVSYRTDLDDAFVAATQKLQFDKILDEDCYENEH